MAALLRLGCAGHRIGRAAAGRVGPDAVRRGDDGKEDLSNALQYTANELTFLEVPNGWAKTISQSPDALSCGFQVTGFHPKNNGREKYRDQHKFQSEREFRKAIKRPMPKLAEKFWIMKALHHRIDRRASGFE